MKPQHRNVVIIWSWHAGVLQTGWLRGGRYTEATYRFANLDVSLLAIWQKQSRVPGPWLVGIRTSAIEGLVAARVIATSFNVIAWLYNYPVITVVDMPDFNLQSTRANFTKVLAQSKLATFQKQVLPMYKRLAV